MSNHEIKSVPFEGDDKEQALWNQLTDLPQPEPGPALRGRFFESLRQASRPTLAQRFISRFGNAGLWLPAAACMTIGLGLGLLISHAPIGVGGGGAAAPELAQLRDEVSQLNRQVLLNQIEQASTGGRLQGVLAASEMVADDPALARALLRRASQDESASVRSAAIDALGPQMANSEVGTELMALLEGADSPLVQLALVDLVLRHGTAQQVRELLELARSERLDPDLVPYVTAAVEPTEA